MTLTVRQVGSDLRVVAETSEPGLTSGVRVEESLALDPANLPDEFALTAGDLRRYGQQIGNAVFHGEVLAAFQRIQARADADGEPLHVLLSVEVERLRAVRWERLCAPLDAGWRFLRLQQRTPFSIYLPSEIDKRYPTISRVDLKALVVVANLGPGNPYGLAEFKAGPVVESIRQALGKDIPCKVLASDAGEQLSGADGLPTLTELCRWLTVERFPILHLVCHGKFDKGDEKEKRPAETYLFLRKSGPVDPAKPDGHIDRVPATELIERLEQLQGAKTLPHLTFLCSCETASPRAEQGLGGLGQRLVRKLGMPAVVAMAEPVSLPLTQELASAFYQHLRNEGFVDVALDKACAGIAERGEVLIPTLFSRLGGRMLFDEFGPLTLGEWEKGLERLGPLVTERAPSLRQKYEEPAGRVRAALEIRKRTENSPSNDSEATWARDELQKLQPDLNELCEDFLESPFDELARDRPLRLPKYDARCPFPGLGVFDVVKNEKGEVEDFRPFFFGRRQLTEKVCGLLREHRFLAVLGGSGTGKSSLVRAGVLSQLRKEKPDLQVMLFPPGKDPLGRLRQERARTAAADILVVDQFEELFTLCTDENAREAFLAELLPLRELCPVVITMRTDFLAECAEHDELHALLNANAKHLELLQPLRGDELRDVVEQQQSAVGLQFEPELAKRIFEDLEHEPGAMPLLQHCLRQLWRFRRGRRLCFVDYLDENRVGGVEGAISRTADEVYTKLSPVEQQLCPFIFERLVRIDTEATDPDVRRDTRQREDLSQLTPEGGDSALAKAVVTRLADAKLLVTTQNPLTQAVEVEVAHEALIRRWDKLQTWIANARVTARLVERVRADAARYYSSQANPDNLTLRGVVLVEAETLLSATPPRLTQDEASFIRLCRTKETDERDRELQNARERAQLAKRVRNIVIVGAGAVVALVGLTTWFWTDSIKAKADSVKTKANSDVEIAEAKAKAEEIIRQQRENELAALNQRLRMTNCRRLMESSQAVFSTYPQRGVLLAVEALRIAPEEDHLTQAAESNLRGLLANIGGVELGSHPGVVEQIATSPDGRWLATGDLGGNLALWSLTPPISPTEPVWLVKGDVKQPHSITRIVFAADSKRMVSVANNGVTLWNLEASTPVATPLQLLVDPSYALYDAALDTGDRWLAVPGSRGGVYLWNLKAPDIKASQKVLPHSKGATKFDFGDGSGPVEFAKRIPTSVAFDRAGQRLAIGDWDGEVDVWDLAGESPKLLKTLSGFRPALLHFVRFSPDGKVLCAAGAAGACAWKLTEAGQETKPVILSGHQYEVNRNNKVVAAIDVNGERLVTGGPEGRVLLWEFNDIPNLTPKELARLSTGIQSLAISNDSKWIAAATLGANEVTLIELVGGEKSVVHPPLRGVEGNIDAISFAQNQLMGSPTHQQLPSPNTVNHSRFDRVSTGKRWLIASSHEPGRNLAVRVWDLEQGSSTLPRRLQPSSATGEVITDITFDAKGMLAASSTSNTLALWDISSPESVLRVYRPGNRQSKIAALKSTPFNRSDISKRWFAAGAEGAIYLWNSATDSYPNDPPQTLPHLNREIVDLLEFRSDGQILLAASRFSHIARLWNLASGKPVAVGKDFYWLGDREAKPMSTSPDRKWDVIPERVGAAGFSGGDGHWLAVTDVNKKQLLLWDTNRPSVPDQPSFTDTIDCEGRLLAFSNNGRWMAVAGGGARTIHIYDLTPSVSRFRRINLPNAHRDDIHHMIFSPDSEWLVSGGRDSAIRCWRVNDFGTTPKPIELRGHDGGVLWLALSQNGAMLASAGEDKIINLWDMRTLEKGPAVPIILSASGKEKCSARSENISQLAFNRDGNWLAVRRSTGPVELFPTRLGELEAIAARTAGRNLSQAEWEMYFPDRPPTPTFPQPVRPSGRK